MLKNFAASVSNAVTAAFLPAPFSLQDLKDFPYIYWVKQQERYNDNELWYSGQALNEKIAGTNRDKYPLHINPIKGTCEKHASVLLGNTLESIRDGGVPITFVPEGESTDAHKVITDALINSFLGSGAGSLFVSNGIISQYQGGCVWGTHYDPTDKDFPVKVSTPLPTEFLAYPSGNNFWELEQAWFIREITWVQAKAYGYPIPDNVNMNELASDPASSGYKFYYIEKWTKDEYRISINERTLTLGVNGEGVAMEGKNPYGKVPFVYIPHLRVKGFLGESMITDTIKGIIKEMNLRNADLGDAVSDDAHSVLAIRGVRSALKSVRLPDGRTAVDLGSTPGLGTGDIEPDLFSVQTKSASEPQLKFTERLDSFYRVEAKHPAVADGLDEGSQRSALTLTTRMWPLQAHVELERINWTTGLLKLAEIILQFCVVKGAYKISKEHQKIPLIIKWATMLPRDREALVNEVAIRKKNGLVSRQHGISLFGDVENVEHEIKLIDEDAKASAALEPKPEPFGGEGEDFGAADPQSKTEAKNQLKKEE